MSYETFTAAPPQKPEVFSRTEKEFLNMKLQAMHDGALLEEDFGTLTDKEGNQFGLYSNEAVENDKADVERIKRDFEINDKERQLTVENYDEQQKIMETSRFLEALMYEKLGGTDGWLPDATVYKTSEYDDYVNGIDFVVELEKEHFGLAVDVTLSRRPEIIINKLKKGKKLIDRNALPEIKYYERPDDAEHGAVPFALIALDYKHAVQALKFWADGEDTLLAKHPTRVKAWLETSAQFDAYQTYAKQKGKTGIAEVYERAYQVMQRIITANSDAVEKYRAIIEEDQAYQTIINFCDDLKQAV